MINYIKSLIKYGSLAGVKEFLVLVFTILAARCGITLNEKAQQLLTCWSSFQLLIREERIQVVAVGDHEFKLTYAASPSGKNQIELALRVPVSISSDLLVFNQIFLKMEYQHVLEWFSSVRPQGKIGNIVDLGGNIGCAALYFSTQFPEADIFSLEPEAGNYARLRLNLESNSGRKIKSYQAAIWTESCKLQCVHDFRDKKESSSRFVEPSEAMDASAQPVDAISIQTLMQIAGFERIDLLKIDVEGAEAALLRDADFQDFIKEKVSRIAVEVHEEFITIKEVTTILHPLGFETKPIDEFLCGIKTNL